MRTSIEPKRGQTPGMAQPPANHTLYSPRVRSEFSADYWTVLCSAVAAWVRRGLPAQGAAARPSARPQETPCPH